MRLPRFILNPSVRPWILLWQRERRANARLRAELREWQGKFLEKVNTRPLFTPAPKPIDLVDRPPIGPTAKAAYLKTHVSPNAVPTAEDILASAERAKNGNG